MLLDKILADRATNLLGDKRHRERMEAIKAESELLADRVCEWLLTNYKKLADKRYFGGFKAPSDKEHFGSGHLWVDVAVDTRSCEIDRDGKAIAPWKEEMKPYCVIVERFSDSSTIASRYRVRITWSGGQGVSGLHKLNVLRKLLSEPEDIDYQTQIESIKEQMKLLRNEDVKHVFDAAFLSMHPMPW